MNEKQEQLWIDMMTGMQDRAAQLFNDDDPDKRNRNWYAREVYGDRYTDLKEEFQRIKIEQLKERGCQDISVKFK